MASLKLLLGIIPSTSKIEQNEKALITEFEKLHVFSESEVLARYNELNGLVNSSDFLQKCKEIKSLQYKNSEEYTKEKEYLSLQKARDIVLYFKTTSGNALKRFKEMEGSNKITEFESLEKFIQSPGFREKQKMRPITFKDTDEYRKFDEYKSLKKDPEIKSFLKSKLKEEIKKSKAILRYEELVTFIKSPEFLAKKNMSLLLLKILKSIKNFLNIRGSKEVSK